MNNHVDKTQKSRYTKKRIIGEGTYGIVYKAMDNQTGIKVALKKSKPEFLAEGVPATTLREISLLKMIHHPNVVQYLFIQDYLRLYDVFFTEDEITLVFEYLPQSLRAYLEESSNKLSDLSKKILFYQIVKAVAYLHSRAIMHRDLKPCNILVTKDGKPKIADFGLGRRYQLPIDQYTHEVGTIYYSAPELLLGAKEYSTGIDTWALGCMFAEIYNRKVLFQGDSKTSQLLAIFQVLGTPEKEAWPGVVELKDYISTFPKWKGKDLAGLCPELNEDGVDLLKKMLAYDPLKRTTCRQALNHPFFRKTLFT